MEFDICSKWSVFKIFGKNCSLMSVHKHLGSTAAGNPIAESCGTFFSGESFLSTTNAMTVVFQSDYSVTLRGMLANYIEGEKRTFLCTQVSIIFP